MNKRRLVLVAGFLVFALFLGALLVVLPDAARDVLLPILGPIVVVTGLSGPLIALGARKIPTPWGALELPLDIEPTVLSTPPKELSPEVERERRNYLSGREHQLPGFFAPAFHLLDEKLAITVTPCADPMTPMYMLDRNFRIIDWNLAFSMCFDRTMEGRRGRNVLEWTYFLDNYEEALNHGIAVFGEGKESPRIDIEKLTYTSDRYGLINGTKRAYQIPDDDGSCLGWLTTIKPAFSSREMAGLYHGDLFGALRKDLMWSEYALSYDKVLVNSLIYPELINTLIGRHNPGPGAIPGGVRVLDLGAGTGNTTNLLAEREAQRLVVAIDNNPVMLSMLRDKCAPFLREDAEGPGVIAIKQDISSLYGLDDGFFDYVVLNNVLYSLEPEAVKPCLKEVLRVLKPGGEFRLSEPHKDCKVFKVLDQIGRDLKRTNRYAELEKEYRKVRQINEYSLAPLLRRWSLSEMKTSLCREIGFAECTYATDDVYAGQSMLICARK